jgi:mono/diheme cytochrome c family protein
MESGPGGTESQVMPVASYFSTHADAQAKSALAAALAARTDEFSKQLLTRINAAPVEDKPMVRKHQPDAAVHARGLAVYNKTCIACHGPDGKGVPMAFPPLDGSQRLTGEPTLPVRIVLHGLQGPLEAGGQKFNNIMAPLGNLSDAEIADVLTYVRQSWRNDAPPVNAAAVKPVRDKHSSRAVPWTLGELK